MNDPTTPPGEPAVRGDTQPRRLYRHPKGPIGGVASGLAAYFDVDPAIVRLLFIIGAFAGFGFPTYLICWVAIPKARKWPPPGYDVPRAGDGRRQAGVASGLVVLALAALAAHSIEGVADYVLPAALIGFGVFLLTQPRYAEEAALAAASDADAPGEDDFENRAPSRTRQGWGRITPVVVTALCLLGGAAFASRAAGLVDFSWGVAAAVALLGVGGGLLATVRYGAAPGLIPLGIALSLVVAAHAAFDSLGARASRWADDWDDAPGDAHLLGAGDHEVSPTRVDELSPSYRLSAGELSMDLTALDFTGLERSLDVRGGVGELTVLLPRNLSVETQVRIGAGEADVLGSKGEGLGVQVNETELVDGAGRLTLSVRLGAGEVKVRRGE